MDTVALVGRLLLSLAFVLGVMWLIARRVKRGPGRTKNGRVIDVIARQQLSRSASVAVVRVLDQALIVGITDGQVAVLGETDLAAVEQTLDAEPARKAAGAGAAANRLLPGPVAAAPSVPARRSSAPTPSMPTVSKPTLSKPARHVPAEAAAPRGALAGSALSPHTWRQTLETLRDLTARRT